MKTKKYVALYVFVCCVELAVILLDLPFRFLSKPLVMVTLMVMVLANHFSLRSEFSLFFSALIFALIGDVFLLQEGEQYFLCGIASFFIMQILYAYTFYKQKGIGVMRELNKIIAVSTTALLLNVILWNHSGGLRIPILFYSISILAMAITGIIRWKVPGYKLVFWGVLLFVFSDSYLGINKFRTKLWGADFIIMLSYMMAQGLIVFGYVKSLSIKN